MSLEEQTQQQHGTNGTLSEDVMECMSVQKNDGTYNISLPKGAAEDLGLEKSDRVLITGQEDSRSLSLQPSDAVLND